MVDDIKFLLISAVPEIAKFAIKCGVDFIFIDLEINGKEKRQGHLDTVISKHNINDVVNVRKHIPDGKLLVRVNPIYDGTDDEIDKVINAGADALMLPMFKSAAEVSSFLKAVNGRAKCVLLVETVSALKCCDEWLNIPGIDQIHIGLNDLHLELGTDFMFEALTNGFLDDFCKKLKSVGIPFGIGGVARLGEGMLPADILLAEHVRLGSTWAILSRTFHREVTTVEEIKKQMDFDEEIKKLRIAYRKLSSKNYCEIQELHELVCKRTQEIVDLIRARRLSAN